MPSAAAEQPHAEIADAERDGDRLERMRFDHRGRTSEQVTASCDRLVLHLDGLGLDLLDLLGALIDEPLHGVLERIEFLVDVSGRRTYVVLVHRNSPCKKSPNC